MKKSVALALALLLGAFFQNCSDVSFSGSTPNSSNGAAGGGIDFDDPTDPGLDGGHFDLDTSSQVYALSDGQTDHHVHEYDDKYNVNYVDFFNLLDPKFTKISTRVAPNQQFIVIVANSHLSPGGVLEINGTNYSVVDYQRKVEAYRAGAANSLSVFTLTGANGLNSFKMKFKLDALNSTIAGLIPTQTSCVVKNDPGLNQEYRNGALTVQILDAATAKIDPSSGVATPDGGLLWEATVFWHKDNAPCY